jgi:NAD(P)-dependent dehydrogenase (short-subunit alcohol dehydrogenase family)
MARLAGKRALITGGTSGIGLGIAERFLREGACVAITGRDRRRGNEAVRALSTHGTAYFLPADAGLEEDVDRSVRDGVAELGGLDILVNNAGIAVIASLVETPVADFDRMMAANVRGPFLYGQAAFAHLKASRGNMIHISSDAGVTGEQPIAAYSVSKAAVIMLSKMFALDGAPYGVRSNCICPGGTEPGMRHIGPPEDPDRGEDTSSWPRPPLGRLGRPEDIAAATVFLASDEASFYSGSVLLADGAVQAGRPA